MSSLEKLFQTNVRMSPSRSRKPVPLVASRRAALNRATQALARLKEAQRIQAKITKQVEILEREYYKLARRAAAIVNANLKTGPLNHFELIRLNKMAEIGRNIGTAIRTVRRLDLPPNIKKQIIKRMPYATAT